jgi:hypothetical protein
MITSSPGSRLLVVALLATLVLWNVPYGWIVLYPFKIFATWLHESAHGVVMLATGAGLERLEIFRDTSGLAHPSRGVSAPAQALISSAGYMGTALFGALFLVLGRTDRGGRRVLLAVAAAMTITVILAIRNGFGAAAVGASALALAAIAIWGGERLSAFMVSFLAAQSCINAVLDIRLLFGSVMVVNGRAHRQSDADTVARVIGGPPWMWAAMWLVWSFVLFYVALRLTRPRPIELSMTPSTEAVGS